MKITMNALALALTFTTLTAAHAGMPVGSFRGESTKTKGADAMAFIVRKDPKIADRAYGVLMHYDRITGTNFTRTTAVVKWVPRMWVYQIDKRSDLNYKLTPLTATANGGVEAKASTPSDSLVLKRDGQMDGAKLTLAGGEIVKFRDTVISTWEPFVAGKFFRSVDSSGKDYFKKEAVNTVVHKNGTVDFNFEALQGKFTMVEALPGIYTFTKPDGVKNNKMDAQSKIGVFIDIMNWKKIAGMETPFKTNELMIADPANPSNVGFFYERVFK